MAVDSHRSRPRAPGRPSAQTAVLLLVAAAIAAAALWRPGYEPFALVDAGPRPRVQWSVEGTDANAWSTPGADTAIRVFRGTAGPPPAGDCLDLGVVPPDELGADTRRLTVTSGAWHRTLTLRAKRPLTLKAIPLTAAGAEAFAPVRLAADGEPVRLQDGRRTRFNVASVARAACAA